MIERRETWHQRITPKVLEAFQHAEAIRKAGDDERWESDGGKRREMLDAEVFVQKALGLPIWLTVTVFDVDEQGGRPNDVTIGDWETALTWRRRLLAAAAAGSR